MSPKYQLVKQVLIHPFRKERSMSPSFQNLLDLSATNWQVTDQNLPDSMSEWDSELLLKLEVGDKTDNI